MGTSAARRRTRPGCNNDDRKDAAMTTYRKVSARIDTNLKDEFSKTLEGIGLDYTSAVKSFAYQLVRKRAIPFEVWSVGFEMSGKTAVASVRLPEDVADGAMEVLSGMGISFSTAVRILALETVASGMIPFRAGE